MNLSSPLPRNRLLALEQELQAQRPVAVQQNPIQPQLRAQTDGTQEEAASATWTNVPSPQPTIQPSQHHPVPTLKTAPPLSFWQVLAARLTQRSFPEASFPEPELTPPHFPSNPINVAQEQSLPNVPFPTRPIARAPYSPVSLHPVTPSHRPDNQAATSEDAVGLTNWKDLADQIQQARSRSVQQSQMPHPSAIPPEAVALSAPADIQAQATEELLRPQPAQAEYQIAENPAPPEPPQVATGSAPGLEVRADTTTEPPSPSLQEEPCETWEQDLEDISTIDIVARTVDHSEPSSDAPAEVVTETAIVPIIITDNDSALLPHTLPDFGASAQFLLIRAGPPALPPHPLPELSPGSTA